MKLMTISCIFLSGVGWGPNPLIIWYRYRISHTACHRTRKKICPHFWLYPFHIFCLKSFFFKCCFLYINTKKNQKNSKIFLIHYIRYYSRLREENSVKKTLINKKYEQCLYFINLFYLRYFFIKRRFLYVNANRT